VRGRLLTPRSRNVSSLFDEIGIVSEQRYEDEFGNTIDRATDEEAFKLLFGFD